MSSLAIVHGRGEQRGGWLPAREQYDSTEFALKAAYADQCCDDWVLVSAEHDLFTPETRIATYDSSLDDLPPKEQYNWARRIHSAVREHVLNEDDCTRYDEVVALVDAEYRRALAPVWNGLDSLGIAVDTSLSEQGSSEDRMAWLRQRLADHERGVEGIRASEQTGHEARAHQD